MKDNLMEKSVTLRELTNYAASASYQSYCEGSAVSDFDPGAEKWQRMADAAEIIAADFFFGGDRSAAKEYFLGHGESEEFNMFISDPDDVSPEVYDEISEYNMSLRDSGRYMVYDGRPEEEIPFD